MGRKDHVVQAHPAVLHAGRPLKGDERLTVVLLPIGRADALVPKVHAVEEEVAPEAERVQDPQVTT